MLARLGKAGAGVLPMRSGCPAAARSRRCRCPWCQRSSDRSPPLWRAAPLGAFLDRRRDSWAQSVYDLGARAAGSRRGTRPGFAGTHDRVWAELDEALHRRVDRLDALVINPAVPAAGHRSRGQRCCPRLLDGSYTVLRRPGETDAHPAGLRARGAPAGCVGPPRPPATPGSRRRGRSARTRRRSSRPPSWRDQCCVRLTLPPTASARSGRRDALAVGDQVDHGD